MESDRIHMIGILTKQSMENDSYLVLCRMLGIRFLVQCWFYWYDSNFRSCMLTMGRSE